MKSLAKFFLTNKALSWLMLILMLGGGIFAYNNMGKLEDAPFIVIVKKKWFANYTNEI